MAKKLGPPAAALQKFTEAFAKSFPDTLTTFAPNHTYDFLSTGSISLDHKLGGGFVKGRLVELWGPEQTGKSTLLLLAVAAAQKAEPTKLSGWVDVEKTFDPTWAKAHGVDMDRLILAQPDDAEQVADIVKDMINSDLFNFITLDSIGAMIPKVEKEKDADEATMAVAAKVITRMVKIAAADAPKRGVVLAVINQVRANLSYGGDITRTGGFALSHVTTHRLKFRRTSTKPYLIGSKADGTEEQVGQEIAIVVEKNKIAPPKRTATVTFFNQATEKYGPIGIERAFDAFTTANICGVFGRRGSRYDLPDGSEHNGKEAVLAYLRSTPAVIDLIRERVIAAVAHELVAEPMEEG